MAWKLRKAVPADRARIEALFVEMVQAIEGRTDVAGLNEGDLDHYFDGGEDWICVAEADAQVVGFLSMEVHREDVEYIYLDDLSVSAAYRGQGIGTALLKAAEAFAREIGFHLIVLHVKLSNAGARRLYERMGYTALDDDGDRCRMLKNA